MKSIYVVFQAFSSFVSGCAVAAAAAAAGDMAVCKAYWLIDEKLLAIK
jgi:hypothetical protein